MTTFHILILKADGYSYQGHKNISSKLTPIQRLYAFDCYRGVARKITKKIVSDRIEVIEMYDIETIDDLIWFDLLKMLSLNIPFKKCKHCGCYFVPLGRSDMKYCSRVLYRSQIKIFQYVPIDDTL